MARTFNASCSEHGLYVLAELNIACRQEFQEFSSAQKQDD